MRDWLRLTLTMEIKNIKTKIIIVILLLFRAKFDAKQHYWVAVFVILWLTWHWSFYLNNNYVISGEKSNLIYRSSIPQK